MPEHSQYFEQMLKDANVPTDKVAMDAAFAQVVTDSEVTINNSSPYSPFWRAIKALITVPALWLVGALIATIIPNLFVKTATGVALDILAWSLDVTRKKASKLTGIIDFYRVDNAGELEIPIDTEIQTDVIKGVVYSVVTTQTLSFNDGDLSLQIPVEATKHGFAHNLGAGYFKHLPEPISGVTASNAANWISSAGADQESDDDLRLRCRNQFTSLTQYHTNFVYTKILTDNFAGVGVNNIFFSEPAPRGPGTRDIYILLDTGQPDQTTMLDVMQSYIMDDGYHGHGDDLQVLAMPDDGLEHELTVTVRYQLTLSDDDKTFLNTQLQTLIECAFRQGTEYNVTVTKPHSTFSFSLLTAEIFSNLNGFNSVEFDLDDITTGLSVPRLQSITVVEA